MPLQLVIGHRPIDADIRNDRVRESIVETRWRQAKRVPAEEAPVVTRVPDLVTVEGTSQHALTLHQHWASS